MNTDELVLDILFTSIDKEDAFSKIVSLGLWLKEKRNHLCHVAICHDGTAIDYTPNGVRFYPVSDINPRIRKRIRVTLDCVSDISTFLTQWIFLSKVGSRFKLSHDLDYIPYFVEDEPKNIMFCTGVVPTLLPRYMKFDYLWGCSPQKLFDTLKREKDLYNIEILE